MLVFLEEKKKKMKFYKCRYLNPKLSILDETDSGLDIDALENCFRGSKCS